MTTCNVGRNPRTICFHCIPTCLYLNIRFLLRLTDNTWLEIYHNSTGNAFSVGGLRKKCGVAVVTGSDRFIGRHNAIWLDSMFKTIQFPARISHLYTGLSNVNGNTFSCLKRYLYGKPYKQCEDIMFIMTT